MSDMLDRVNPKFVTWLGEQRDDVKAQVEAQWQIIKQDADIEHTTASGQYARQFRLLAWCAGNLGYDFT